MKKLLGVFIFSLLYLIFPQSVNAGLIINEFSSGTSNSDWVEVYNNSNTELDLTLYKLLDKSGNEKLLSGNLVSEGFISFDWSNRLNNDGDIIYLVQVSDLQNIDTIQYGSEGGVCAPSGSESAGRYENGNVIERFSTPTKGLTNVGATLNSCPTPSPDPTQTPSPEPTQQPTQTPSPTPVVTKSPTPKPTVKPTVKPTKTPDVLGAQDEEKKEPTPTPTEVPVEDEVKKPVLIPTLLIGSGVVMLVFVAVQLIRARKNIQKS